MNNGDQEAVQIARGPHPQEVKRPGHASHVLRELFVVKLHLTDGGERLGQAGQGELGDQPEGRHGRNGGAFWRHPGHRPAQGDAPAALLHEGGDEGRQHSEENADPHPLQKRDAFLFPRVSSQERDDDSVVERDEESETEHWENGVGGGRNLEVGGS